MTFAPLIIIQTNAYLPLVLNADRKERIEGPLAGGLKAPFPHKVLFFHTDYIVEQFRRKKELKIPINYKRRNNHALHKQLSKKIRTSISERMNTGL